MKAELRPEERRATELQKGTTVPKFSKVRTLRKKNFLWQTLLKFGISRQVNRQIPDLVGLNSVKNHKFGGVHGKHEKVPSSYSLFGLSRTGVSEFWAQQLQSAARHAPGLSCQQTLAMQPGDVYKTSTLRHSALAHRAEQEENT